MLFVWYGFHKFFQVSTCLFLFLCSFLIRTVFVVWFFNFFPWTILAVGKVLRGVACVDLTWLQCVGTERIGFNPSQGLQFLKRTVIFETICQLQVGATFYSAFTLTVSCCCYICTQMLKCSPIHMHRGWKDCQNFNWWKQDVTNLPYLTIFCITNSMLSWISHRCQNPCYI